MTGHVTAFGSKFDSIADALLGISAAIWLVMFQPELITDNLVLCCRSGRLSDVSTDWRSNSGDSPILHLYSTKITTVVFALS